MKISNKNHVVFTGCLVLAVFGHNAYSAPVLSTDAQFIVGDTLVANDPASGPPPATISSGLTTAQGSSVDFAGDAFAHAVSTTGVGAVRADGVFAFGDSDHELRATASFGETVSNSSATTQNYFYDFNVFGPLLEIDDYAFGSGATVEYSIQIELDGTTIWNSAATLLGGAGGFSLTQTGTDLGASFFCLSSGCDETSPGTRFGYTFGDFSDRLSLGAIANGDSFTLETIMAVSVSTPPFEKGGLALIGDPGSIGTSPGISGSVGVVPVPAAVWLFGSGLIGLVGLARRKAA